MGIRHGNDCEFSFVYRKFIIFYISSGNHQKDPKGASETCFKLNNNAISGCSRQFWSDFDAFFGAPCNEIRKPLGIVGVPFSSAFKNCRKRSLEIVDRRWITPLSQWPGTTWPKSYWKIRKKHGSTSKHLFNPDLGNKEVVWCIFWWFLRLII